MADESAGGIIGRNVRTVREGQLFSRADLAKRSGVSLAAIDNLERGESARPRRRTIEKLAEALGVEVGTLIGEVVPPLGEAPPVPQASFDDVLEEDRRLRYLRVAELFAAAMNKQWSDRVERDLFSEEDLEHGVHTFGDFENAYITGIGTGLLAALRMDAPALPAVELEALEHAEASINAWHSTMWLAYKQLGERGAANVIHLDACRARLQASRFEKAGLDATRRDVTA